MDMPLRFGQVKGATGARARRPNSKQAEAVVGERGGQQRTRQLWSRRAVLTSNNKVRCSIL